MSTRLSPVVLNRIAQAAAIKRAEKELAAKLRKEVEEQKQLAESLNAKRKAREAAIFNIDRGIQLAAENGEFSYTHNLGEHPDQDLIKALITDYSLFNPMLHREMNHAVVCYDTGDDREYYTTTLRLIW